MSQKSEKDKQDDLNRKALEIVIERIPELELEIERLSSKIVNCKDSEMLEKLQLKKSFTADTLSLNRNYHEQLRKLEANRVH